MIGVMSKTPKKPDKTPKPPVPVLYLRLDADMDAALKDYIASQEVAPDRTAVGIAALLQFLQKHGFWPRKPKGQ